MLEERILLDVELTKRCIEEETTSYLKRLLELWLEYDYELLELLKEESKYCLDKYKFNLEEDNNE